jgi:hypothetical protein
VVVISEETVKKASLHAFSSFVNVRVLSKSIREKTIRIVTENNKIK